MSACLLAERFDHRAVEALGHDVELHGVHDRRQAPIRQELRHHRHEPAHFLNVTAEVSRSVEVGQEEFRGVVEALALQQIPVGAPKPRPLPGAQPRAPLAEGGVLDDASAQLGRPVERGQQEVAKRLS